MVLSVSVHFFFISPNLAYTIFCKIALHHFAKSLLHLQFLDDHPEFMSNPFYVAGDSFSGIFVPLVTHFISQGTQQCKFELLFPQMKSTMFMCIPAVRFSLCATI